MTLESIAIANGGDKKHGKNKSQCFSTNTGDSEDCHSVLPDGNQSQLTDPKKKPDTGGVKKKKPKETSSNKTETETELEQETKVDDTPVSSTEDETYLNFTELRTYEATASEIFLLSRINRHSAFTQMGLGSVRNGKSKQWVDAHILFD